MAQITVIFDKPTTLSLPFEYPNGRPGNLTLGPGNNLVCEEEWKCVTSKHAALLKMFPEVKVMPEAKAPAKAEICDITAVTPVSKAITIIENTFDIVQINAYLAQEKGAKQSRKTALEAIENQISKFNL